MPTKWQTVKYRIARTISCKRCLLVVNRSCRAVIIITSSLEPGLSKASLGILRILQGAGVIFVPSRYHSILPNYKKERSLGNPCRHELSTIEHKVHSIHYHLLDCNQPLIFALNLCLRLIHSSSYFSLLVSTSTAVDTSLTGIPGFVTRPMSKGRAVL